MTNSISKFYQTNQQLWSRWCEEYAKNLTGNDKNEWIKRQKQMATRSPYDSAKYNDDEITSSLYMDIMMM